MIVDIQANRVSEVCINQSKIVDRHAGQVWTEAQLLD